MKGGMKLAETLCRKGFAPSDGRDEGNLRFAIENSCSGKRPYGPSGRFFARPPRSA